MNAKSGWLSSYYPYSGYEIKNNQIEFIDSILGITDYKATSIVIQDSHGYSKKSGGGSEKHKILSLVNAKNINEAFSKILKKIKITDNKENIYLVSLQNINTKKIIYRIYIKK
jgi:hypothetical protein